MNVPHLLHLLGCHCRGAGVTVAGLVLVLGRDDDRRRVVPVHFALEIGKTTTIYKLCYVTNVFSIYF